MASAPYVPFPGWQCLSDLNVQNCLENLLKQFPKAEILPQEAGLRPMNLLLALTGEATPRPLLLAGTRQHPEPAKGPNSFWQIKRTYC